MVSMCMGSNMRSEIGMPWATRAVLATGWPPCGTWWQCMEACHVGGSRLTSVYDVGGWVGEAREESGANEQGKVVRKFGQRFLCRFSPSCQPHSVQTRACRRGGVAP
jgi:hypothetical protein